MELVCPTATDATSMAPKQFCLLEDHTHSHVVLHIVYTRTLEIAWYGKYTYLWAK